MDKQTDSETQTNRHRRTETMNEGRRKAEMKAQVKGLHSKLPQICSFTTVRNQNIEQQNHIFHRKN